ncbi:hypothetical protein [uncultured Thiodictyon sp.]|jgi:hypothetical protein|uniref:hypothetical protein n=1 Tax=uncultured Thiodictyon sp. TaxID=1846217 RepID=UPI0025D38F9E|nr:hypothetical protein [uncultured Thiodictyon sp.]
MIALTGRPARHCLNTMPPPHLPVLALLAALLVPAVAAPAEPAGQTHFSSAPVGDQRRFDYRWVDQDGSHTLSFQLDEGAIAAARREFRAYRRADLETAAAAELDRQLTRALDDLGRAYPGVELKLRPDHSIAWQVNPAGDLAAQHHARFEETLDREFAAIESDYPGARISRGADGDLELHARSKADLAAIQQRLAAAQRDANAAAARLVEQAQAGVARRADRVDQDLKGEIAAIQRRLDDFKLAYFRERLYRLDETGGLLPDYARIAARALPALAPLAQALRPQIQGLSTRAALNRVLAFIQTIPYDRLEDRATDAGFLPPPAMLADNRGDCDTKSVAFAALAHLLFPRLPITLILVPRHALLGLGLEAEPGDRYLLREHRTWVLAEPVGPGIRPVGRSGPESAAALEQVTAVVPLFP